MSGSGKGEKEREREKGSGAQPHGQCGGGRRKMRKKAELVFSFENGPPQTMHAYGWREAAGKKATPGKEQK